MWPSASITFSARVMVRLLCVLVLDPLLHVTGVAITFARHLRPASKQTRGRQQQAIAHVGRVVAVLLERRMTDLLVMRVVLEFAGGHRQRLQQRPAFGASL